MADDPAPAGARGQADPLGKVRVDTFRSPGKGGQNVNKVETGVRITHLATGLSATATTHRTQLANRKLALERLRGRLDLLAAGKAGEADRQNWGRHNRLERGNPVMSFSGPGFEPVAGD
jgi:peptide chain release factor